MKFSIFNISRYHVLSFLTLTISATYWSVGTNNLFISVAWMSLLLLLILLTDIRGMKIVVKRMVKFGLALAVVSLYQIIFRRSGDVVFAVRSFPLIFSDGLRQAILLWMRYLIVFEVALLFARVNPFHLFLFFSKWRLSYAFNLLLLVTLRFLPFVGRQARLAFWTMRFNGIDFRAASLRGKFHLVRKMLKPILHSGIQYASISALALELRGYGSVEKIEVERSYSLGLRDFVFISLILVGNFICFVL